MLNRRMLLRRAVGLAAARFLAGGAVASAASRVRPIVDPFTLGVASGEPSTDGFMLWTRLTGLHSDAAPGFEIAEDEGFRRIVRSGRAAAPVARGGAVHLEVRGLSPGHSYFYRFHLGGATSRVGRSRTIAARPEQVRLALTSCQHWEHGWFSAYRDMVAAAPDAVVQIGDYIYEKSFGTGPDVRSFGTPVPTTLADYRARHALYRTDPDLAAAHAALPFIVSWDDHEVENDYAGDQGALTDDPAAFLRLRAAAYQAYFEHMPLRPASLSSDGGYRLYRRFGWGDLVTLNMLDTRQYRTPHPAGPGGKVVVGAQGDVADRAQSMLGAAQEAWLADGLAHEAGRWTLIAQQTLFARLVLPQGPGSYYSDIWDGYAGNRARLSAQLASPAVRNAVVLGGDLHSFWINDLPRDFERPGALPIATEIVTSCLASRSGPDALFAGARDRNPHVRFLDNRHSGYVLLDLAPERLSADLRAVRDLTDPASRVVSLARFAIEDGRPGAIG